MTNVLLLNIQVGKYKKSKYETIIKIENWDTRNFCAAVDSAVLSEKRVSYLLPFTLSRNHHVHYPNTAPLRSMT